MDNVEKRPARRRSLRTLVAIGACTAAVASAGVITTFASAATADEQVGFENCRGSWTAAQGSGTFTLGDLASDDSEGGGGAPGDAPFEPIAVIDDEAAIDLVGVVDISNLSLTCNLVNNETLLEASFIVRWQLEDGPSLCANQSLNQQRAEVGIQSRRDDFTYSFDTQCDNPQVLRVVRQATTVGIG